MSATTKASEPNDYDAKIWIAIFIVDAIVGDVTATGGSLWARIMWMRNRPSQMYKCTCQKSGLTTLKGQSRQRENEVPGFYHVQMKHRGWISPRVCTCACSFSYAQIPWFSKGRFIKNNYVTPVLNSLSTFIRIIIPLFIYLRNFYEWNGKITVK